MKPTLFFRVVAICAALASLGTTPTNATPSQTSRQVLDADSGWRFMLGDPSGAEARRFADGSWRTVNLPHDWSIEGVPEKDNPTCCRWWLLPWRDRLVSQDVQRAQRVEGKASER